MILHGSNSAMIAKGFFFNRSFAGICAKTLVVNQWSHSCIIYIFGQILWQKPKWHNKMIFWETKMRLIKQQTNPLWKEPKKMHLKYEWHNLQKYHAYSPFQMSFITWLPPAHSPREQLLHFTFNSDSMWSHFKTVYYLCKLLSRGWVSLSRGLGCYSEECLHSSVCWATFESHPAVAVHQIMVKPSQTSPPLARTASRSEPRSLHPSSFSSSSTYGSAFAFAYHCVCNSFLALLPQPLLSETCPFKATTSALRLISGSPWGDGGEKKYYATTCIWLNSTSVAQSIIPLLRFSLGGVICIHKAQVRSKIFRLCFIFVGLKSALLFRLPYICVCCKPTRKSHFDFDWIQSKGSTI